jgi:DNA-binding Lrp family transcriptional regulator
MRLTNGKPLKEKDRTIDDLDKRILQQMSKGISSYEELAKDCNVTRSTVYRRVTELEKEGYIRRITRTVVDYEKLDVRTICFACKVSEANQKRTFAALKTHKRVKLLWRTFGDHNVIFMVFCNRGEEGQAIGELRATLEKCGANEINVSVGFVWEKMDFTPFIDEEQDVKQLQLYYSDGEHLVNLQRRKKSSTSLNE